MKSRRGVLPTLTEVIDVQADARVAPAGPVSLPPESLPLDGAPEAASGPASALRSQLLAALLPRIDALLQAKLQAAMAPQRARPAAESTHRLRSEMAEELRALVAQAVDEALSRHRKP